MAETQLTHKLRNPKSYNSWINIWTSHVEDGNTYNIYPSSNWKIPVSQLSPNVVVETNGDQTITNNASAPLPSNIEVSINQIKDTQNTLGANVIPKTGNDGKLMAGPTLNNNGSDTKILNEKGQWISITGIEGITVATNTSSTEIQVKHSNTVTGKTEGPSSATTGSTLSVPYVTYDNHGHITNSGTYTHTITGFITSNGNDTIDGSRVVGNNSLSVDVIDNPTLESFVRGKTNTKTTAGVVSAGDGNDSKVWATDANGNPSWKTIASDNLVADNSLSGEKLIDGTVAGEKLDTQLFGVWIADSSKLYKNPTTNNYDGTFTDLTSEWDENHCGIWIEI